MWEWSCTCNDIFQPSVFYDGTDEYGATGLVVLWITVLLIIFQRGNCTLGHVLWTKFHFGPGHKQCFHIGLGNITIPSLQL